MAKAAGSIRRDIRRVDIRGRIRGTRNADRYGCDRTWRSGVRAHHGNRPERTPGLEQTVQECNSVAGGGTDPFGRMLPAPFKAPFYGIKVQVALYHTQGGLKVNIDGQVLRADGSIIPNFYAGGGVATGISGTGVEGYLPGNGQLASLGLGMIAGEHATASLKAKV